MSREVVQSIYNADRTRRVDIFRREDGNFGFEELRYGVDEQAWYPCGCYTASFTATPEAAAREAHGRVAWLAELTEDETERR
jgi:hypothetical protein